MLGAGAHQVVGDRPGERAGAAGPGVDLDPGHPRRLQEDRAAEVAERRRPVPGPLRRHAQAVLAGEADHRADIVRVGDRGNRGGVLVGGEVPGLAGEVPTLLAGHRQGSGHRLGEAAQVLLADTRFHSPSVGSV